MVKRLGLYLKFLAFCALLFTSVTTHAAGKYKHDKDDDKGRGLYGVKGSTSAVAEFLQKYQDKYDLGYPLRVACDFPTRVTQQHLLFVCDQDADAQKVIQTIFNEIWSAGGDLNFGVTNITLATAIVRHCGYDQSTSCSYYSGPYCPTPGYYHTQYYCAGLHKCI